MNDPFKEIIEEYHKHGFHLQLLNKLITKFRQINDPGMLNPMPKLIIQLGRQDMEYIKTMTYTGKGGLEGMAVLIISSFSCEIEEVNKDFYFWIREKL